MWVGGCQGENLVKAQVFSLGAPYPINILFGRCLLPSQVASHAQKYFLRLSSAVSWLDPCSYVWTLVVMCSASVLWLKEGCEDQQCGEALDPMGL